MRQSASIREGDPVRVFNDRGDFEGVARVTDDVQEGVIVATLGYWRSLNRSDGSVNSISSDALLQPRPGADLLRQSGRRSPA